MEDYTTGLQNPNNKTSPPQINSSNMELFNNLGSINHGFNTNVNGILPLSNEVFYDHQHHHQSQVLMASNEAIPRSIGSDAPIYDPLAHFFPSSSHLCNGMNTMSTEPHVVGNSSTSACGNVLTGPNKNYRVKKRKMSGREMEKPREVVHVRAKRGQATDSHSLAERLRREKINEKLKCLQDLVPGCYKTMGMAVMLDVIINYVRSLQNQIDFLSMKLSAASLFYDFNSSEAEAMEALQGTTGYEAPPGMEKIVGEGYGEIPQFQSWPL